MDGLGETAIDKVPLPAGVIPDLSPVPQNTNDC